jgi:hypothetical protein
MPSFTNRASRCVSFVSGLGFLLGVAACHQGATTPSVTIKVASDTVRMSREHGIVLLQVTSVIVNNGPGEISLPPCSPQLQRNIDGRWHTVWSPACIPESLGRSIIANDSAVVPVKVIAYIDTTWAPRFDHRLVSGTYRLLWSVEYKTGPTDSPKSLPSESSVSPSFRVEERE